MLTPAPSTDVALSPPLAPLGLQTRGAAAATGTQHLDHSGRPLKAGDFRLKFSGSDAFYKTVKARIDRYFKLTGQNARDCWQMYLKTSIILLWLAASYTLLLVCPGHWYTAVPLALSLGLSMAAVGFNIQHDGGHKAYSNKSWVNKLMSMSIDLIGGSSYVWDHKHNTVHHTYANITDHDDDINVGFLGRLSPHQKWYRFHRLQHLYLWVLYAFLPIKWQFYDDFYNIANGKIGIYKFSRPKGWNLVTFIAGKAVFYSLTLVLPSLFHPFLSVLGIYLIAAGINGICLAVVFQLAHVVEEAQFPLPDGQTGKIANHWAVHQVETTVDFARDNWALSWFLGGLNFQIEHHLFPRICHVHYRKISRLVENACKKFGIQYHAHKDFWAGVASHFRLLHQMGRPTSG